jgi:SAM-dependent methyltransferase
MPVGNPGAATGPGEYWDSVYERRGAVGVSWFQAVPQTSLDLIRALGITPETPVVDAGAGAGTLTGHLAAAGFTDLTAVDISAAALAAARARTAGLPGTAPVSWVHADLLSWRPDRRYGLWHDRAVYHFLTGDADRAAYLATLRAALRPGGIVILAAFAPGGPARCSGLPVARYSPAGLARSLGAGFTVLAAHAEQHMTPDGVVQPFSWVAGSFAPSAGGRRAVSW